MTKTLTHHWLTFLLFATAAIGIVTALWLRTSGGIPKTLVSARVSVTHKNTSDGPPEILGDDFLQRGDYEFQFADSVVGDSSVLTDGPTSEPKTCRFRTDGGAQTTMVIDLRGQRSIHEIRLHTRSPHSRQKFSAWQFQGTGIPQVKSQMKPAEHGWQLLANVDSKAVPTTQGSFVSSRVYGDGGIIANCRYLLLQIAGTAPSDTDPDKLVQPNLLELDVIDVP